MKKILALAVLASALSSCVVSVGVNPPPPTVTFSNLSIRTETVVNGTSTYVICNGENNNVSLGFKYAGNLSQWRFRFLGNSNGVNATRPVNDGAFTLNPSSGNFTTDPADPTSISATVVFGPLDVTPLTDGIGTQAVVVTRRVNPAPYQGSMTVKIEARDTATASFSNVATFTTNLPVIQNCVTSQ